MFTSKQLSDEGWKQDSEGNWFKPTKKQLGRTVTNTDNQGSPTQPKHNPVPEPFHPNETEKDYQNQCRVCITVFRTRPIDPDNHFVKWHIDAIRRAGLLIDDDPTHVDLIIKQVKVKHRHLEHCSVKITYP